MPKFTLESFKDVLKSDTALKEKLAGESDIIDFDNGTAIIHKENINRYLERYICKNEKDLEDTLWYSYGIFVKFV